MAKVRLRNLPVLRQKLTENIDREYSCARIGRKLTIGNSGQKVQVQTILEAQFDFPESMRNLTVEPAGSTAMDPGNVMGRQSGRSLPSLTIVMTFSQRLTSMSRSGQSCWDQQRLRK